MAASRRGSLREIETGDAIAATGHRLLPPVGRQDRGGRQITRIAAEQNKPSRRADDLHQAVSSDRRASDPCDPDGIGRVDHEAEAGVVIGRRASHVMTEVSTILGLTCVNDVTARELQAKGVGYTRAKGFDTFAPVGPCIVQGLDYTSPDGIGVEGLVNGTMRQSSSTRELIFPIPKLVAFISAIMTLLPGDIISTGTPSGIGPLVAGDSVTIKVHGVGELTNPVINRL
jgi:2-keto-4-pentenoate hydratase/2-oxohepta-3-ene-1,7-dioic acid hydratase in catechol pathway